jgi:hypothetical protein
MLYRPSFRKSALALTAVASMMAGTVAHAAPLTPRECGIVFSTSADVITHLGPSKFDPRFPDSLAGYMAPGNREQVRDLITGKQTIAAIVKAGDASAAKKIVDSLTCDGSPTILTKGVEEIAAFNTIRTLLLAAPAKISLQSAGLKSVDPAELASAKTSKRTDASVSARTSLNLD